MLLLAIDTSGDIASLALATEETLVTELDFRHKMDLLKRLMPNIERIVTDSGKLASDLDGIVISLGPGSFTGLRIGMAAAKSLAHVLDKPIVGIKTLDLLAHGASAAYPKSIIPLIHARPGEVFWAIYDSQNGVVNKVTEDKLSPLEDVIEEVKKKDGVFCGSGAERNRDVLAAEFGKSSILDDWFNIPHGSVLAVLGIERLARGDSDDVMSIAPNYIQKPTPTIRLMVSGKGFPDTT